MPRQDHRDEVPLRRRSRAAASRALLLAALIAVPGCDKSPTEPSDGANPTPGPTPNTSRVVPIRLDGWSCLACPQPQITATLQGRNLTDGYHTFNLEPGEYELVGILHPSNRSVIDDRDRWDIAFTTFPQLGNPPFITDNGVEAASIVSVAGPNVSYNRAECSVFYDVPDKSSPEFRIRFRVTASQAAGVTCPPRYGQ